MILSNVRRYVKLKNLSKDILKKPIYATETNNIVQLVELKWSNRTPSETICFIDSSGVRFVSYCRSDLASAILITPNPERQMHVSVRSP